MDFQRLFLFLIFSLSVFLLWDGWQRAQHPIVQAVPVTAPSVAGVPVVAMAGADKPSANAVVAQQKHQAGQKITVKTDWLAAEIDTVGGDLRHLALLQHRDTQDKSKRFVLLEEQKARTYIAQTGLLGTGLPTHNAVFTPQANEYQLADGKNTLEVRLMATDIVGAKVTKIYVFHRGSYLIDVGYEIENIGTAPLSPSAYFQFVRDKTSDRKSVV